MNKHEFNKIEKEFEEMIYRGIMPLFEFEVSHHDYDYIIFEICLYNNFIFLKFDTDIVYNIYPSNNAIIRGLGVEYKVKDLEGDTLDKVIEFLNEEATQFLLDSNLLP